MPLSAERQAGWQGAVSGWFWKDTKKGGITKKRKLESSILTPVVSTDGKLLGIIGNMLEEHPLHYQN
jgi:hypothetical protein